MGDGGGAAQAPAAAAGEPHRWAEALRHPRRGARALFDLDHTWCGVRSSLAQWLAERDPIVPRSPLVLLPSPHRRKHLDQRPLRRLRPGRAPVRIRSEKGAARPVIPRPSAERPGGELPQRQRDASAAARGAAAPGWTAAGRRRRGSPVAVGGAAGCGFGRGE